MVARKTTSDAAADAVAAPAGNEWLTGALSAAKVSQDPLSGGGRKGVTRENPFDQVLADAYRSESKVTLTVPAEKVSSTLAVARRSVQRLGIGLGTYVLVDGDTATVELQPRNKRPKKAAADDAPEVAEDAAPEAA